MSRAVVLPQFLTIAQFLQRPPRTDGQQEELIEGEVYASPNVKRGHSEIVRVLGVTLRPLERSGYVILTDFARAFSRKLESLPNPDLGVLLATEWKAVPDDGYLQCSPALVVEVHSRSNRVVQRKAALYLEHGAEQVWIVYPNSRRVRVLKTDGGDYEARVGETVDFAGLHLDVNFLFG